MSNKKSPQELLTAMAKINPQCSVPEYPNEGASYISNVIFSKMDILGSEHLALMVGISRFSNRIGGKNGFFITFPISINMILETMRFASRYSREIKTSLDTLVKHKVISIEDIGGNKIHDDPDRYKGLFIIKQSNTRVIDNIGDDFFDALHDVEGMDNITYTTLYTQDVDKILGSKEKKGNRESLVSVYASIKFRIFNYSARIANGNDLSAYKELSKAVNWEGRDAIAKRIGIAPRTLTKRLTELIELDVISIYYVGFMSVHITDNRMYISTRSDLGTMQRYIAKQIEKEEVLNIFDLRQNATGELEQAPS